MRVLIHLQRCLVYQSACSKLIRLFLRMLDLTTRGSLLKLRCVRLQGKMSPSRVSLKDGSQIDLYEAKVSPSILQDGLTTSLLILHSIQQSQLRWWKTTLSALKYVYMSVLTIEHRRSSGIMSLQSIHSFHRCKPLTTCQLPPLATDILTNALTPRHGQALCWTKPNTRLLGQNIVHTTVFPCVLPRA